MIERRIVKHSIHIICFIVCFVYFQIKIDGIEFLMPSTKGEIIDEWDPFPTYGFLLTVVLYFLRFLSFLSVPICLAHMAGLLFYNVFPKKKTTLDESTLLSPFLCVRVVTRGDYPELVKQNVERNLATCLSVGLEKFIVEVVTDKEIFLPNNPRIRETIVDKNYRSKTDCKYKARALQYALEDDVNLLNDDDWIVHLDEETLLTENCLRGILKFTRENKHQIGQGLITYTNEKIVNWLTTLADSYRVGADMGMLRFCLKTFHRPLFVFKGSYVVTKFSAERDVSFDNGMNGSIAEDLYFALKATNMGYTFDWIEGEMWEKSPFTVWDFLNQRKRWIQGFFLVVHDKMLPLRCKIFAALALYAWMAAPLNILNLLVSPYYPLPKSAFLNFVNACMACTNIYLYSLGAFLAFDRRGYGLLRKCLCVLGAVLSIPFVVIIENIAIIWGVFGDKSKFYVVNKYQPVEKNPA